MKICTLICLAMLLSSCTSQQPKTSASETYLSRLPTLDLNHHSYKSYQVYYDTVLGQMISWLNEIKDPEQLRALFWQCHSAWQSKPEVPQDKLQWIDPHCESKNVILYRLAEIQTAESAKVLVDLRCDPKAEWDAGPSEMASDAVVKCGKLALPYLKKKVENYHAPELIRLIESGATTGL